jgi:hypothetical protein
MRAETDPVSETCFLVSTISDDGKIQKASNSEYFLLSWPCFIGPQISKTEALTVVTSNSKFLWDVMPCSLVEFFYVSVEPSHFKMKIKSKASNWPSKNESPIAKESGWAPDSMRTLWRRNKYFVPAGNQNKIPRSSTP